MRQPVARGEGQQAAGVRRVARADDPQPGALPEQQRPAVEVGAQDQVSEPGLTGQHTGHFGDTDCQDLSGLAHDGGQERDLPLDQPELAEEPARAVRLHDALVRSIALDDRDQAAEHDEEGVGRLSLAEEHVSGLDRAAFAMFGEDGELSVGQPREGAVSIRCLRQNAHTYASSM